MKKFIIMASIAVFLAACGSNLTRVNSPTVTSIPTEMAPTQEIHSEYGEAYTNMDGGFSMVLPVGWQVSGPIETNGYQLYFMGPDTFSSGGPGMSQILIAEVDSMTIQQFVNLQCSTCPTNPVENITLGGLPAYETVIGGGGVPEFTWQFVEHSGKLIGFSLRPLNDESLDWVVESIKFD